MLSKQIYDIPQKISLYESIFGNKATKPPDASYSVSCDNE